MRSFQAAHGTVPVATFQVYFPMGQMPILARYSRKSMDNRYRDPLNFADRRKCADFGGCVLKIWRTIKSKIHQLISLGYELEFSLLLLQQAAHEACLPPATIPARSGRRAHCRSLSETSLRVACPLRSCAYFRGAACDYAVRPPVKGNGVSSQEAAISRIFSRKDSIRWAARDKRKQGKPQGQSIKGNFRKSHVR